MWKNFFYFTRREKSGLIFLIILIGGLFAGKFFLGKPENQLPEDIKIQSNIETEKYQAETPVQYEKKSYYNQIQKRSENNKPGNKKRTYFNNQSRNSSGSNDSIRNANKINKLEAGSKIDLNTADTTLITRVPGIGQSYATRILKYRKILGGFYSVEQLKEIYGMYEELYEKIVPFFNISQENITKISINKASLDQLKSHPYIDFYQAKAIIELRKKNGKIIGLENLSTLEEFPVESLEKLKHYLSFE